MDFDRDVLELLTILIERARRGENVKSRAKEVFSNANEGTYREALIMVREAIAHDFGTKYQPRGKLTIRGEKDNPLLGLQSYLYYNYGQFMPHKLSSDIRVGLLDELIMDKVMHLKEKEKYKLYSHILGISRITIEKVVNQKRDTFYPEEEVKTILKEFNL